MYVQGRDNSIADGLDIDCKRQRGAKSHFKVFDLSKWKDKVAINWDVDY